MNDEQSIHEEFKKKRRTFRRLIAALLVLVFVRFFTTPVEEAPAGVGDVLFIGGLLMIAFYSRLVFRCPSCRASLPQTFALPRRKEFACPECGVRLGE
jgi:drug/metabolite transporter (DMT)-like permease